jgi:hypothetical protein
MPPRPLFQFRAITLHPTPHHRVIGFPAALLQELFDIAKRQVSKMPTNGTKSDCGLGLPPIEDGWSGCRGLLSAQPISPRLREVATLPSEPSCAFPLADVTRSLRESRPPCDSLLTMAIIPYPQQVIEFLRTKANLYFCDDWVCKELDLKISDSRLNRSHRLSVPLPLRGVRPQAFGLPLYF